jgi:hypothetical protein
VSAPDPSLPRAVRHGPPITVTCDCGEKRELRYGVRWRCEQCGRTWDTNRIPIDDYAAIRRTQIRYRVLPLCAGLALLATVIALAVLGRSVGIFLVVPFAFTAYSMFLRPFHRRRYREALAKLPVWQIKPE